MTNFNRAPKRASGAGGVMKTLRLTSLLGIFLGIAMMTIMMIAAPPPVCADNYGLTDYWIGTDGDWGFFWLKQIVTGMTTMGIIIHPMQ